MNKTKIEWCDYTWNPVTGCKNTCPYCYARAMFHRFQRSFEPAFHEDRLQDPLKRKDSQWIFVCSVADLFGPWVPDLWIEKVMAIVDQSYWHDFLFLTKFPERYARVRWPINVMAGITITGGNASPALVQLYESEAMPFVSFEPLRGPVEFRGDMDLYGVQWIIIGAQTGPGAASKHPAPQWIEALLDQSYRYSIPVFMKENLRPYWSGDWRQEFPEHLEV